VNVDTDQFAAITERLGRLEAGLAAVSGELKASLPVLTTMHSAGYSDGYRAGVESVLGRPAGPRPRHLRAVPRGER
jgi:hypothetical protein